MKTEPKYKAIVLEMAQVLSRNKLNTREASLASAIMFVGTVENDMKDDPDDQREEFCHNVIQYFYAEKRRTKSQMN